MQLHWAAAAVAAVLPAVVALPAAEVSVNTVLQYKGAQSGRKIANGLELRILPVGDSITVGYRSEFRSDGDGYRRSLRDNLSNNKVVFAGTEAGGTMDDGFYAAWSGRTIKFIADNVNPSLDQRPNVILLHAGTNDMNNNSGVSHEGNDPVQAADRLGKLIDQIIGKCPDATLLVAMIIDTTDPNQEPQTQTFQKLIPGVVQKRKDAGQHVLAVDFSKFVPTYGNGILGDGLHPSDVGYKTMGNWWYDFITQIPSSWIKTPVGKDPYRPALDDPNQNGGIDGNIPAPNFGNSPIDWRPEGSYSDLRSWAVGAGPAKCNSNPLYRGIGKLAQGPGRNGDWKFRKSWQSAGEVAAGLGLDKAHVRLHDMNGDGKADYVWIDPANGKVTCWLNNLPGDWSPAGSNGGVIASGAAPGQKVFLADMNGDGKDDYLIFDARTGSVYIYWNRGPDNSWDNGWKFEYGGLIAYGVPHANLETIRFADVNGDGRADYVYIGKDGSLAHWLNTGSPGGSDVSFHPQGGISSGIGQSDFAKLVFADVNGDGRDDYLVLDNDGGISGYLNQRTNSEGVPLFINQGGDGSISDGLGHAPSNIRLADMDGDGKADYVVVGDNGALNVWYNRGSADDSMASDFVRFADITGGQGEDYVYLDPQSGAPTVLSNHNGTWTAINNGHPIAAGAAPGSHVRFGDIDGDGYDDYLVLDPATGALTAYLLVPGGGGESQYGGYLYNPIGQIASGLGPAKHVRIADIDGDGRDDYIYLSETGKTTIYRNMYGPDTGPNNRYAPLPAADASGIGQRAEDISFYDINGDGKADYIWTRPIDGSVEVWLNMYPQMPAWNHVGVIATGVGTSGTNVRFAQLTGTKQQPGSGRTDYVALDPSTGSMAGWYNGCDNRA